MKHGQVFKVGGKNGSLAHDVSPARLAVGLEPSNALGAAGTIRPDPFPELLDSPLAQLRPGHSADKNQRNP
jgi:hypothetical protein